MLRRGQDDIYPSNRAATVHTTTSAVQQQYNSTSASNSGVCDSRGDLVFVVCAVFTMRYTCNHENHVQFLIQIHVGEPHPVLHYRLQQQY